MGSSAQIVGDDSMVIADERNGVADERMGVDGSTEKIAENVTQLEKRSPRKRSKPY